MPRNRAIKTLSRGMRPALGIVIGLAAQAEVTTLDEPSQARLPPAPIRPLRQPDGRLSAGRK